jgi:hypothetical protein
LATSQAAVPDVLYGCYLRFGVPPEPVSPELVLIDPELARRERARLEEKAYLRDMLDVPALRRAVESQPPPFEEPVRDRPWLSATTFARRRVAQAALLTSLLVNGFFVSDLVTRGGDPATQVAVRMVTLTEVPSTSSAVSTVAAGKKESSSTPETSTSAGSSTVGSTAAQKARAKASATHLPAKSIVERKVVSLILAAPARKLPRNFIDASTGLVKNNVQVVCEKRKHAAFLCAIRLPSQRTSKALFVRYSVGKGGRGEFKWYGYRNN